MVPKHMVPALITLAVAVLYGYSLRCGFVFDDLSAVVNNNDVTGDDTASRGFAGLIWNDFWGTPMSQVLTVCCLFVL